MKALSVHPHWAAKILDGSKTIEVRSWRTNHRGPLLICSTKLPHSPRLAGGVTVCVVDVVDCRPMTEADERFAGVRCRRGLWAWEIAGVRALRHRPVIGRLGLFETFRGRSR